MDDARHLQRHRRLLIVGRAADVAAYETRVAELVSPALAAWVHGSRLASGIDPER